MSTLDELMTAFDRSAKKVIHRAAVGLGGMLRDLNKTLAARRRRRMIAERKYWYRIAAIVVAILSWNTRGRRGRLRCGSNGEQHAFG
jgi:hypothetical protein